MATSTELPAPRRSPLIAVVGANVISRTGSILAAVVVPWFVLVTTGSVTKTGLSGAAAILPVVVGSVVGGTVVDRLGFRRTSVVSDLLSGLAIVIIPLLYHAGDLSFGALLLLLFLATLLNVPGGLARRTMVPHLAALADTPLERANAANDGSVTAATLVGPLIAGLLIAALGASNVLFLDAASFGLSALLIACSLPGLSHSEQRQGLGDSVADLRVGIRYLQGDHVMLVLALLSAVVNFVELPLTAVIVPVYAKQVFGSAVDLGIVLAALGGGARWG